MSQISVTPEELKNQSQVYLQSKEQMNKYADTVAERDAQDAQSFGF